MAVDAYKGGYLVYAHAWVSTVFIYQDNVVGGCSNN